MDEKIKVKVLKSTLNIILLLAICIINGCFDFLSWEFHFERILTAVFWVKTGAKFATLICAKEIGMSLFEDIKRKLNTNLQENKIRYEKLNKMRGNDFSIWCETVLNPRIKREKYISIMHNKIARLEKRTNPLFKILYVVSEDERKQIIDNFPKEKWKIKANCYIEKRLKLESLMSDEYIDKNINSLNIKCENVNPALFDLTIDAKQKNKNYRVTSHVAVAKVGALVVSSFIMVIGQMIMSTIGYSFDSDEALTQAEKIWNAILNTLMDLTFIAWQFFSGTKEIGKIIEAQEGVAYANRCSILKSYLIETGKIQDENKLDKIVDLLKEKI